MGSIKSQGSSKAHTFSDTMVARVRLASTADAPHLHKLMYELAAFHSITHIFSATEASVAANLFKSTPHQKPFESVTSLILEVSSKPFPHQKTPPPPPEQTIFNPVVKTIKLEAPITDNDSDNFRTGDEEDNDVFVAGYVLFFPNYSGFFEKPGFFMDNLHVRECYRGHGLGTMMFSAVASEAARRGLSMFDWNVTSWNTDTIEFYLKRGAREVQDFRVYRLSGEALESYANAK